MKHKSLILTISLLAAIALAGCIKNDIPYPRLQQNILTIAAEGEASPAVIDDKELTVALSLDETVNLKEVRFSDFTYTEGAECSKNLLEGSYDLSEPLQVTLSLYQNYTWTITATQTIERYLTVAGQIGETTIDVPGKRIVLYVPESADLKNITLTSVKLGPEGLTTLEPDWKAGDVINCERPVQVRVRYWDRSETWTLYVDKTELLVSTSQVDAWVNVIWVYGSCPEDEVGGFQYRQASSTEWIDLPQSEVKQTGGTFSAVIKHLNPLTGYIVRAVAGENIGEEVSVTTGVGADLPNGSFDAWWLDGKIWCPWAEGGQQWWDTGNTGASTLGQSNVVPSDNTPSGTGQSAKLETRFVGIGPIGKLAAGSIYAGDFRKVDGTNGILDMGRPWDSRPTRLRGYYNYSPTAIDYVSTEWKDLKGQMDHCQIWIALTDMDNPWEIRTNPKNRQLFDPEDPHVIAYGVLSTDQNTNGWQPFEITLEYKATNRKPKYLLITAAASALGDYFTGGTGTVLYVDDFSLDYDY